MAKINFTEALGDLGSLRFSYVPDEMFMNMDKSTDNAAVYDDSFSGTSLVMKGTGFASLDGELLKGRVNEVVFKNAEGDVTARITGLDLKASTMHNLATAEDNFNLFEFLERAFGGDDKLTGTGNEDLAWSGGGHDTIKAKGGDDSLNGMSGNDTMTGGEGSDHFFFLFEGKGGRDVITDFDAKGGGDNQDYIAADFDEIMSMKQVGDDVVIDFGFGDRLRLLDTDKDDISAKDFDIPV